MPPSGGPPFLRWPGAGLSRSVARGARVAGAVLQRSPCWFVLLGSC